jgi:hypothetical protein
VLGADIALENVAADDQVTVCAHYYPARRAYAGTRRVTLYSDNGQMAFHAPESGTYVVRLEYLRYAALSMLSAAVFVLGAWDCGGRSPHRRRPAERRRIGRRLSTGVRVGTSVAGCGRRINLEEWNGNARPHALPDSVV